MTQSPQIPPLLNPRETAREADRYLFLSGISLVLSLAFGIALFLELRTAPAPVVESLPAAVSLAAPSLNLNAEAALLLDLERGEVVYEKNADESLPLASLTKLLLGLLVVEELPLEREVVIPYYVGGSTLGPHFSKGETRSVREILDFTLISSSNTGSLLLAEMLGEEIRARVPENTNTALELALERMNERARELGMDARFSSVHGLDASPTKATAYASARSMARLLAYIASGHQAHFEATARESITFITPKGETMIVPNTNLVQGAIPGFIFGKTGLTDLAGGNLAVVFMVGLTKPFAAIVLGSTQEGRFSDMRTLVDAAEERVSQ